MAYEHDPNRINQPRSSYEKDSGSWGLIIVALVVAGALAFIFLLLPASETPSGPKMTENQPKVERPATPTPTPAQPPAKAPAPTAPPAPAPATPQQ